MRRCAYYIRDQDHVYDVISFVQRQVYAATNNKGSNKSNVFFFKLNMSVSVLMRNRQNIIYAQHPLSAKLCTVRSYVLF